MIIMGIDPGTVIIGYGVIENSGKGLNCIEYGFIPTQSNSATAQQLKEIDRQIAKLIKKHKPQQIAVEDIFFFKNAKTVIKVSQARGVILARAARTKVPVREFTPLQVKQAVTSYGRAEKQQVQKMVKVLLNLKELPKPDDAADALAVAICCAHSINNY